MRPGKYREKDCLVGWGTLTAYGKERTSKENIWKREFEKHKKGRRLGQTWDKTVAL